MAERVETDTAAGSGDRALSWGAFGSTYLPALLLALGTGIALPAIPTIAKSFHVSFGVASSLVTVFLLGGLVGTVPSGWLVDRYGRRRVMMAGPIITSATAFLVAGAHTFPELLVYRFVGGFAAQMWLIGRLAAIAHGAAADQRGRQVSWMYGMDNTGKLAGPLIGGFVAVQWGVRAPFVVYGALALVALVPAVLYTQDTPRRIRADHEPRVRMPIRQIVGPRLIYFAVALFASLTRGPVQADLLQVYAAFAYHLGPQGIGYLATVAALLTLPISFTAGWMMDRFGRKRTMIPGFIGVSIAMAALALSAFAHLSLFWFVGLFLVEIAFQALTGGSIQTIGADVAPAEARGMFLGLWRFTGQLGQTGGPVVFALLASQLNYGSSFVFTGLCAVVVAYLLVRWVPELRVTQRTSTDT